MQPIKRIEIITDSLELPNLLLRLEAVGVSGYTVIKADNLDAAVALAKGCPILAGYGGSIEVCETFNAM